MMRYLMIGLWVCIVTLASSYGAASWSANNNAPKKKEDRYLEGLEYRRVPIISVPMIQDGQLTGYVLARFVYTADAKTLHELPVQPDSFVADEIFQQIYEHGKVQFGNISKYNIPEMTNAIKTNVNTRMQTPIIHDILIEALNYMSREEMERRQDGSGDSSNKTASSEAPAGAQTQTQ